MIAKAIGIRIKELREEQGVSQETLANTIGMSRTYFAEVETGKRNISMRNLTRITIGLGISPAKFFDSELFDKFEPPVSQPHGRVAYKEMHLDE